MLYKSFSFNLHEEEPQLVSSPIVRRFDELANAPSSASERKRRREKLTDQEVVKSAAKTQAVVQTFPTFSDQQQFGAIAVSPRVAEPYVPNASPAWDASAQRLSVGANAPLPRSALSSPQLSTLFASPDRVRKQSDEEKRCICFDHSIICKNLADLLCQNEVQAMDRTRCAFKG